MFFNFFFLGLIVFSKHIIPKLLGTWVEYNPSETKDRENVIAMARKKVRGKKRKPCHEQKESFKKTKEKKETETKGKRKIMARANLLFHFLILF